MDKTDHLMAVKNKNNKDSQKGQVTQKIFKKDNYNTVVKINGSSWDKLVITKFH